MSEEKHPRDQTHNFGEDVLRIAREQNVSQASALRAAAITSRLNRRLPRKKGKTDDNSS